MKNNDTQQLRDQILSLFRQYKVTASHPQSMQCRCIDGAIGHVVVGLESIIHTREQEIRRALPERIRDEVVDQARSFKEMAELLKSFTARELDRLEEEKGEDG